MSLNTNKSNSSRPDIPPMEPGTYMARTVIIADLGLQVQAPFKGESKPPVEKVSFTYEFVDEFLQDEEGHDLTDKPRHLSEDMAIYPLTAERAKSTLRAKALDPTDSTGGNLGLLVDTPCMVTVVHNPRKDGGVWENIANVAPMTTKAAKACVELVNKARVFDLDEPDLDVFKSLPNFIQKKIVANLNFEGSKLQEMLGSKGADPDDEIPFEEETWENEGGSNENPY